MFKTNPSSSFDVAKTIESALHPTFGKDEIVSLAGLGDMVTFAAGEALITEGTPGTHVYLITSGQAEVSRQGELIATLADGEMVGEQALVTGSLRNATVTAVGAVEALVFDERAFTWLRFESIKAKELSDELVETRS